jgi:hypothetical protein
MLTVLGSVGLLLVVAILLGLGWFMNRGVVRKPEDDE